MSLFQISMGLLTFLCFVWCGWKCARRPGRYARMVNGLLALVWLWACVLIIKPELASMIARMLGIGRGTDLVFYVAVLLAVFYAMFTYYRLCDIRKDITLIVRHIAIAEHQIPAENERVESKDSNVVQTYEKQPKVKNKCTESKKDD